MVQEQNEIIGRRLQYLSSRNIRIKENPSISGIIISVITRDGVCFFKSPKASFTLKAFNV